MVNDTHIAVIIPAYRVTAHIIAVISRIGPEVERIYVVDDACPDRSGDYVAHHCKDPRVLVLRHETNQGVGGAMISGYEQAMADGMTILIKIDGDGQMDPSLIPLFIRPILEGQADYTKGNRFYHPEDARNMPLVRLIGNAAMSIVTKLSSGYWNIIDPNNGYTAIHAKVLALLPLEKIHRRYFFESDMLFRLNTVRAVVTDIPMKAIYADERSYLRVRSVFADFIGGHVRNFFKRIFYNYFLRDVSVASLELVVGIILMAFGTIFGVKVWLHSLQTQMPASSGTVMLAALPIILGFQLLLSFLAYDVQHLPTHPLHKKL